uniref:Alternative protein WDR26 n=1 Tax=Homo sapiens TaxID=9606 RepID=L8EAE8_HUMAN|nr:alternative protein WDR26 [Homo sapiens]
MAWDLVQTNMIDSWTDMLVMKKEPFLKPDWGQTFTPCFIVTS